MSNYVAFFVRQDGMIQSDIGRGASLKATTREGAIEEASKLHCPLGANYLRIEHRGRITAWIAASDSGAWPKQ